MKSNLMPSLFKMYVFWTFQNDLPDALGKLDTRLKNTRSR